jgi:hypothetical protein
MKIVATHTPLQLRKGEISRCWWQACEGMDKYNKNSELTADVVQGTTRYDFALQSK